MASIASAANPQIKRLRALRSASRRDRGGLVLLEGVRLCEEALADGLRIAVGARDPDRLRRTSRGASLDDRLQNLGVPAALGAVLDSVSDTVTCQGIVLAVNEPAERWPDQPGPIVLILDGIRDPGNVGTILRTAVACGLVRTVVAIDCADVWGAKAVRAGLGSQFRLTVITSGGVSDVRERTLGRPWLVADSGEGVAYDSLDWRRDCVLVIGGEAEGASSASLERAGGRVRIPMADGSESLNAGIATAVILFEAARQRRQIGPA